MTIQDNIAPRRSVGAKRSSATEDAVLDAAEAILQEKGPEGLSMEAVARAARAGKATLYRWWPTRGALILAVYKRRKYRHAEDFYADQGSLEADISTLVGKILTSFKTDQAGLFRYVIAAAQSDDGVRVALAEYRDERVAKLQELFERAAARGECPHGGDYRLLAEMLVGFVWQRLLCDRLDEPFEDSVQVFVSMAKNTQVDAGSGQA